MQFRIWCRWGELLLDSTDEEAAIEEALSFALRNGTYVVLMDENRNEIVQIPPAPQTDMLAAILFSDLSPEIGTVALN
jgi:hypothetical protein